MVAWPLLGAVPRGDGTVDFHVWAPPRRHVAVRIAGRDYGMERVGGGLFAATIPASVGDDYRLVLDGELALPDPCSRFQPEGIRGPSRVVGVPRVERLGLSLEELVVYELHVGAFTAQGTFDAIASRLPELRELGVTAIEVMPIATFPGDRNWGYDGVYTSAPHPAYGGPEGFARLVAAAHDAGLGVILDVVYNHIGPGSDASAACASGRSRMRSCGCATTASTGCGSMPSTLCMTTASRTSSPSSLLACTPSIRACS